MPKVDNSKGFTLIELIVLIAILGILSAIAVPRFSGVIERAHISADQTKLRTLNSVTSIARIAMDSDDPFIDVNKSDEELISFLQERDYLDGQFKAQTEDADFVWSFDDERWYLIFESLYYAISLNDGLEMQANRDGWLIGSYTGSAKDIFVPNSLDGQVIKHIGNAAFEDKYITSITFPSNSGVTNIGTSAFRLEAVEGGFTQIEFPKSLENIDNYAFRNNMDLDRIVIGDNVNIGEDVFHRDNSFRDVYENNDKSAGTYIYEDGNWIKQ
ncbi:leucine-rich repeat protein [Halanaerobium sp. Z-7514]|uniref:Leucine-rich repeat protein n=1 Tax=Halanaerobium polyolivorans TaxID=2886943 RepID=A0AAW4WUZ7_9FIRM|nr:leucine-rich repeat protein [Halanaerobium polyolivorans]MCC3144927.1 leucine-rich repeat protein [Halanaerobium polyolivorans]